MLIYLSSNIPWVARFWSSARNYRTIFYVYTTASVQIPQKSDISDFGHLRAPSSGKARARVSLIAKASGYQGVNHSPKGHGDVTAAIFLSPGFVL
jgi:hypothetical protein